MDNFKSSKQDRQTRKDLMIEHVLIELTKTFLLICISIFLFFHGTLLYGFLVGIFAYFYVFYGLFVKVPEEAKPYPYVSGNAWYEQEQRSFENDRRIKIEKIKLSKQRLYQMTTISQSSLNSINADNDDNDDNDNVETQRTNSSNAGTKMNPGTGLPMLGCVDVAGNPYGSFDIHYDTNICSSDIFDFSQNDDVCISSLSEDSCDRFMSDDDWNN